MSKISLPEHLLTKDETLRDFILVRGNCLNAHSFVENSLVSLFAHLLGTSRDFAGVVFFKMNNSRARSAALERMLKKRHGAAFNVFWNSYAGTLQALDRERNNIVHWTIRSFTTDGHVTHAVLEPPNYEDKTDATPQIEIETLIEFIKKCDFIARMTEMFLFVLGCRFAFVNVQDARNNESTWREVFLKPISYPPPDNHPIFQTY